LVGILRALQILALAALTGVLCLLAVILYEARPVIKTTLRDAHITVLEIGLSAKNLREASAEWKKASEAQAQQATETERQAAKSLRDLDAMIQRTDRSVNDELVPRLVAAAEAAGNLTNSAASGLQDTVEGLRPTLGNLARASTAAADTLSDPHIGNALRNLDATSVAVAGAAHHVEGVTEDMQQVANRFRDDYLKPANRAWATVKAILGLGSQSRILFSK
jgi:hypothetical protein